MKPETTIKQQIEILKSRSCIIDDNEFAEYILSHINYYRLSAYLLPYKSDNYTSYEENTNFSKIYKTYEFDRKMRKIVFVAVEEIEIDFRTRISYYFAHKYGAEGYLDPNNYNEKHNHEIFEKKIKTCLENHKNSLIVKHHNNKYGGRFPIWALIELFTFGMLTYFYSGLKIADKQELATKMFQTTHNNVSSWLRCCSDLRNICAHYGRLYYHKFSAIPANLSEVDKTSERSLFGAVCALKALYYDKDKWNDEIFSGIENLLNIYKNDINLKHIGFSENWKEKLVK